MEDVNKKTIKAWKIVDFAVKCDETITKAEDICKGIITAEITLFLEEF